MVTGISVVIGALKTIPKSLIRELEEIEIGRRAETIQTSALLRLLGILWSVLDTLGDLLSLKIQWKTII